LTRSVNDYSAKEKPMQTKRRWVQIVLIALLFLGGCREQTRPELRKIEFSKNLWFSVGKPTDYSDVPRHLWMDVEQFTCGSHELRLIECVARSDSVYKRILTVQKLIDSKWMRDGDSEKWFQNGDHEISFYRLGALHGKRTIWYENGNVRIEDNYENGKREGEGAGWSEDGKLEWRAVYKNDIQIDPPLEN
jgi:hypothetical protein